jgi:hypothetical protein
MILTAKHVSNKNTEKKMLNWDEYNKEDTQVAPAIKNTTTEPPKHAEPIAQSEPVAETPTSSY